MFSFEYSDKDLQEDSSGWNGEKFDLSEFDVELRSRWEKAQRDGHFRYKLEIERTKIIGEKQYVAQLNVKRATQRRPPDAIMTVSQPFNPKSFNFTKIKQEEILFEMKHFQYISSQSVVQNGITSQKDETCVSKKERNLVIINVSPLEFGHVLLVPDIDACRPQILTEAAVQLSIETLLLSRHRGFRVGFNSLCAFASVNHQHLHAYYLERELFVESCTVQHLTGVLYEQTVLPSPGFAFQLHGTDIKTLARTVAKVADYFLQNEIAHNLFMTRGSVFGEPSDSPKRTIRIYLWPRQKFVGIKEEAAFNVALVELAGHLPIKIEALFDDLDEQKVEDTMKEGNIDDKEYASIKESIIRICQE